MMPAGFMAIQIRESHGATITIPPTALMLRLSLRHTNFQIHLLPQFYETTVLKPTPIVFDVYEYVLSTLETVISRRWIHIGIVTFRKYAR